MFRPTSPLSQLPFPTAYCDAYRLSVTGCYPELCTSRRLSLSGYPLAHSPQCDLFRGRAANSFPRCNSCTSFLSFIFCFGALGLYYFCLSGWFAGSTLVYWTVIVLLGIVYFPAVLHAFLPMFCDCASQIRLAPLPRLLSSRSSPPYAIRSRMQMCCNTNFLLMKLTFEGKGNDNYVTGIVRRGESIAHILPPTTANSACLYDV